MRNRALRFVCAEMAFLACLFGALLAACTGDPQKDAATAQGYIVAYQPIASEVACTAQKAANVAGNAATGQNDPKGAMIASLFSQGNGLFCNGLAQGAPLPVPVMSPIPPATLGVAPAVPTP